MAPQAGNVYDYPQYFDLLFRDETRLEADFVAGAARKYLRRPLRTILEPGCGGGRLVVELARRGYHVTGFDCSEPALRYLRGRLQRRGLTHQARVIQADLAEFRFGSQYDLALCTFNTFRHLINDRSAVSHLRSVAQSLRPGGMYILGFHLLPYDVAEECTERWTARHGRVAVSVTLRILATDRQRRLEQVRLSMLVRQPRRAWRMRTEFPLRMYTARQFRGLLAKVPEFELLDVYDFWYELDEPLRLNDEITDSVFILRKR